MRVERVGSPYVRVTVSAASTHGADVGGLYPFSSSIRRIRAPMLCSQ